MKEEEKALEESGEKEDKDRRWAEEEEQSQNGYVVNAMSVYAHKELANVQMVLSLLMDC